MYFLQKYGKYFIMQRKKDFLTFNYVTIALQWDYLDVKAFTIWQIKKSFF